MSLAVARTLPLEQVGLFFLSLTIITFLSAISSLGLNQSLLRFIGAAESDNNWEEVNSAYRFAMQFGGIFSVICAVTLWLSADWIAFLLEKPGVASSLRAIAPAIVGLTLFTLHAQALQALHETLRSILILNIVTPFLASVLLLLIAKPYSSWVASLYALSTSFTLIFALGLWWKHSWAAWPNSFTQTLWHSCLPLWIVIIVNQIHIWGGVLVAGFYVSASDIALLMVAQRISILVSFVLMVVNVVMAPRFAALWHQKQNEKLVQQSKHSTRLTIALTLPFVIIIFIFAKNILLVFGEEYNQAVILLRILITGQLVTALAGTVSNLLMMSGDEKSIRNITLISGVVGLLLSLTLVSKYGVLGAACSTAMVTAFQNIWVFLLVKRRLGFWNI